MQQISYPQTPPHFPVLTHTLDPWGGGQKLKYVYESSRVAYQIKGNGA